MKNAVGLWTLAGLAMLPLTIGCFVSVPPPRRPPPPLTAEEQTEVDAIQKQAQAIIDIGTPMRNDQALGMSQKSAGDAVDNATLANTYIDRRGEAPMWLHLAHEAIKTAATNLAYVEPPSATTCVDEKVKVALPEACAKILDENIAQPARAQALVDRAKAAAKTATEALKLANSEDASRVARNYAGCPNLATCVQTMQNEPNKLGAYAGLAFYESATVTQQTSVSYVLAAEKQVVTAEKFAQQATEEAQKIAASNTEKHRKLDDERPHVEEATAACDRDPAACKSKCEKGEAIFCIPWGQRLMSAKPPNFDTAGLVLGGTCDQFQSACALLPQLAAAKGDYEQKLRQAWNALRSGGDDLTLNRWETEKTRRYSADAKDFGKQMNDMAKYEAAILREHFCPAKKEFLQQFGEAEFARTSAAYCAKEAPVGNGYSGGQVTLTTQCRAAYATPCP